MIKRFIVILLFITVSGTVFALPNFTQSTRTQSMMLAMGVRLIITGSSMPGNQTIKVRIAHLGQPIYAGRFRLSDGQLSLPEQKLVKVSVSGTISAHKANQMVTVWFNGKVTINKATYRINKTVAYWPIASVYTAE